MVRLVKGAYWDSEIKRAQVDGLDGYPVFTRKAYTDVSYLACAKRLLAARDAVFPQFATHNAQTLSAVYQMAGAELLRPASTSSSACTAWASRSTSKSSAPGKLEPALPHLRAGRHARDAARLSGAPAAGERRQHLLRSSARRRENAHRRSHRRSGPGGGQIWGRAASSYRAAARFVRRRAQEFDGARSFRCASAREAGTRHRGQPGGGFGSRANYFRSAAAGAAAERQVVNPANHADIVGYVSDASALGIEDAMAAATASAPKWARTAAAERAAMLERGGGPAGAFHGAALRADRARGGPDHAQRHFGGARGRRLPALLRRPGPRARAGP